MSVLCFEWHRLVVSAGVLFPFSFDYLPIYRMIPVKSYAPFFFLLHRKDKIAVGAPVGVASTRRLAAALAARPPPPLEWRLQGRPCARSAAPCEPPHAWEMNRTPLAAACVLGPPMHCSFVRWFFNR
jgi:hypothetical protein